MKYMRLDQRGSILAEYVWIDGSNGVRCKTKVSILHFVDCNLSPTPPVLSLAFPVFVSFSLMRGTSQHNTGHSSVACRSPVHGLVAISRASQDVILSRAMTAHYYHTGC